MLNSIQIALFLSIVDQSNQMLQSEDADNFQVIFPDDHQQHQRNDIFIQPQQQPDITKKKLITLQTQIESNSKALCSNNVKFFIKLCLILVLFISITIFIILISNLTQTEDEKILAKNWKLQPETDLYDLIKLNSSTALCLDGSAMGYYVSRYGDPSRIYLHFSEGGWCGGQNDELALEDCYQRSKTSYGSTKGISPIIQLKDGIFSLNANNYFRDWKKIFFVYCDGSVYQGTRNQPIQYKDSLLYFRGHNGTVQRLQDLQLKLGLFSKAQKVVIAGDSAGGLAASIWANYISERVQTAQFRVIADVSIFYDSYNIQTQTQKAKIRFKNMMKLSNKDLDPPLPQCILQFSNSKQNCMFIQNFHKFIKPPYFSVQPYYDTYGLQINVGVTCDSEEDSPYTLKKCNDTQLTAIKDYRKNITSVLQQISQDKKNGVYGIGCTMHISMIDNIYFDLNYAVPPQSNNTQCEVLKNWMQNSTSSNIHIDTDPWPYYKPCYRKG